LVDNPGADAGTPKDPVDIAVGTGSINGALDLVQQAIELEEVPQLLAVPKTVPGPVQVFHEVLLMAKE
jgi:hypothetical protein